MNILKNEIFLFVVSHSLFIVGKIQVLRLENDMYSKIIISGNLIRLLVARFRQYCANLIKIRFYRCFLQ